MPSPIAHSAMGYLIYRIARRQVAVPPERGSASGPLLLLATIPLSLLPDIDSVPGVVLGDFGRYHNNLSHSLIVGIVVALVIGVVAWLRWRSGLGTWFLLALACYELHVIMDLFTIGRGVMVFWPLSRERFQPPFYLFYGLHWSDAWHSLRHVWTVLTELVFVAILLLPLMWQRVVRRVRPMLKV